MNRCKRGHFIGQGPCTLCYPFTPDREIKEAVSKAVYENDAVWVKLINREIDEGWTRTWMIATIVAVVCFVGGVLVGLK